MNIFAKRKYFRHLKKLRKFQIEYYLFTFHWFDPIANCDDFCHDIKIFDRECQVTKMYTHEIISGKNPLTEVKNYLRKCLTSGFFFTDRKTTIWVEKPTWGKVERIGREQAILYIKSKLNENNIKREK